MKLRSLFVMLYAIAATQFLMTEVVFAMGSSSDSTEVSPAVSVEYSQGKKQIENKDWTGAITSFEVVIQKDSKNPDAFNYLGYASRQLGEYEKAFLYYNQALALNPNHRGANEYIGEAYLMTGNLPKAEEHLLRLGDICTFGCVQYTMLKRAVVDFKDKKN